MESESSALMRFGVVGFLGTAVYIATTRLLCNFAGWSPTMAASAAFLPIVIISYFAHHSWTFRTDRAHAQAMPRFLVTATGGLVINMAAVAFGNQLFPRSPFIVLFMGIALVVTWNYTLSRLWAFSPVRES
jgi:putative flippase GtrA